MTIMRKSKTFIPASVKGNLKYTLFFISSAFFQVSLSVA